MSTADLKRRVAALERQVAVLLEAAGREPQRDAWKSFVGIFADDPDFDSLQREILRVREEDRALTRDLDDSQG